MTRYSRQELFAGIGRHGQGRLRQGRVLVVGCGALGSVLALTATACGDDEPALAATPRASEIVERVAARKPTDAAAAGGSTCAER